jgi:transposase
LERCAWARRTAFNAALAWHRAEIVSGRPVPSEYVTSAWLRVWRKTVAFEKPDITLVPTRIFEYVAEDLERGWKATQSGNAGALHFDRYDPLTGGFAVDQSIVLDTTHIRLPVIGKIRLMPNVRSGKKTERMPVGTYAYARVTKDHGEWFVSVIHVVNDPIRTTDMTPTIGIDPGVRKLAVLSDGTIFENPKALDQVAHKAEKARLSIARKQRAVDKKIGRPLKRGEKRPAPSKQLRRARRKLGIQLLKAANIRKNAIHHATTIIAAKHVVVAIEDTLVKNMTQKRVGRGRAAKAKLNKRILDAAPGMFINILDQKLRDRNGGGVIRVNAEYTSQDCSDCGHRNNCGSSETYVCASCGLVIDRDLNAAKNILARARIAVAGWSPAEKSAWEQGKTLRARKSGRKARAKICAPIGVV